MSERGRTAREIVACAVLLVASASSRTARADDVQAARQAYDRGAAAYDAGDYAQATSELMHADDLFPNDVALELALKAAVKADDPRMAVRLAQRADLRTKGGSLAAAAASARERMAGRTGTITVTCPGQAQCAATIDAGDVPPGGPYLVLVGAHHVTVRAPGGRTEAFDVRVQSLENVDVKSATPPIVAATPEQPRPAPIVRSSGSDGLSPVWFWVSLGASAVLGGAAIASAVDTRSKHEDFTQAPTSALQEQGRDAQLRTNLLAGAAGAFVVTTGLLGLVFVRWSSPAKATQAAR